jgi:hypothetical protein
MNGMFSRAAAFNQPIGGWIVSNVDDMAFMFSRAIAFNQDIGEWDMSGFKHMGSMLRGASAFKKDLSKWKLTRERMIDVFGDEIGLGEYLQRIADEPFVSNIKVVQTIEEYNELCVHSNKNKEECEAETCPICSESFIVDGSLSRPTIFHKSANTEGKEIWTHPICTGCFLESINFSHNDKPQCSQCREISLITTQPQMDEIRKIQEEFEKREKELEAKANAAEEHGDGPAVDSSNHNRDGLIESRRRMQIEQDRVVEAEARLAREAAEEAEAAAEEAEAAAEEAEAAARVARRSRRGGRKSKKRSKSKSRRVKSRRLKSRRVKSRKANVKSRRTRR